MSPPQNPNSLILSPLDISDDIPKITQNGAYSASVDTVPLLFQQNKDKNQLISPKMFIIIVSFFNGLYQIRNIAEFMYQKEVLHLSPNIIQLLMGVTTAPYTLKPIFGFLYDKIVYKFRKTKYVIFGCSFLRIITSILISYDRTNWVFFTLMIFLTTIAEIFERIVAESSLVISTKKENEEKEDKSVKSNHLPLFFGFKSVGSFIGLFFGGRIMKHSSVYFLFFVTGLLPIIPMIFCLVFQEQSDPNPEPKKPIKEEYKIMKEILLKPRVLAMALFIFLIHLTPSYDSLTMFYLIDTLHFTTEDLADLSSCSLLMFILALIWYSYSLYKIKPKKIFMGTNFFQWLINVSFLLIVFGIIKQIQFSEKIFCLLNYGANSLVAELNFMPILAIWCAFCPKNLEATAITLFTALISLSYNFGTYFGIILSYSLDVYQAHLDNFWLLLIIQNAFLIVVLLFISIIGFPDPSEDIEVKEIESNIGQSKVHA